MRRLLVAFDIDGTLIQNEGLMRDDPSFDTPIDQVVDVLKFFAKCKNVQVLVWSGGGKDYAEHWVEKMDIKKFVWKACCKCSLFQPDIAFDDQHAFEMADKNVIVRNK